MERFVGWGGMLCEVEHCVWEGGTYFCVDCGGTVYCV